MPKGIKDNNWQVHKGILYHQDLLNKGILAITPKYDPNTTGVENENTEGKDVTFRFKGGNFAVKNPYKEHQFYNKIKLLQAQRLGLQFQKLLNGNSKTLELPSSLLINKRDNEEGFVPLVYKKGEEDCAMYAYPWITDDNKPINLEQGFDVFHIVGGMFGAKLKGIDQLEFTSPPLIKHKFKFHQDQKIVQIIHNPKESSPYEEALLHRLNQLAGLIHQLAPPSQGRVLYYHLPYWDYIFIGIEFFVNNRITYPALRHFFREVYLKKIELSEKIKEIFKNTSVKLVIESPLENIFGDFSSFDVAENFDADEFAEKIIEKLELSKDEIKRDEKTLVARWLELLKTNTYKPQHRKVWEDFSKQSVNNIYDLLKLGNAVMLGVATLEAKGGYKTCAIAPLSEKQIQLEYQKIAKINDYGEVFNLTMLEPVVAYSPVAEDDTEEDETKDNTKEQIFYFDYCQQTVCDIINKEKFADQAVQNAAQFSSSIKEEGRRYVQDYIQDVFNGEETTIEKTGQTIEISLKQSDKLKLLQTLLFLNGYDNPAKEGELKNIKKSKVQLLDESFVFVYTITLTQQEFQQVISLSPDVENKFSCLIEKKIVKQSQLPQNKLWRTDLAFFAQIYSQLIAPKARPVHNSGYEKLLAKVGKIESFLISSERATLNMILDFSLSSKYSAKQQGINPYCFLAKKPIGYLESNNKNEANSKLSPGNK